MAKSKIDSNIGGFYLWPPSWVVGRSLASSDNHNSLIKCVYKFEFDCKIEMEVSSHGYFLCNFANIQDGKIGTSKDVEDIMEKLIFRMRFLNLILVSLYTAYNRIENTVVEKHYVDINSYYSARSMNFNPYNASSSIQQHHILEASLKMQNPATSYLTIYSEEVLIEASHLVNKACKQSITKSALLSDIILHAFHLHEKNHFEISHTASWAIIEQCLNVLWNKYINGQNAKLTINQPLISSERRQKLAGRDFSASVISEILSLSGDIEHEIYIKINKARKDRNDWLHKLIQMNKKSSALSLNLAAEMLRKTGLLDVEFTIELIKPFLINRPNVV